MGLQTLTCITIGLSFVLYIGIAHGSRATTTGNFPENKKGPERELFLYLAEREG